MKRVGAKMMNKEVVFALHAMKANLADAKQAAADAGQQARAERIMKKVGAKMMMRQQLHVWTNLMENFSHVKQSSANAEQSRLAQERAERIM